MGKNVMEIVLLNTPPAYGESKWVENIKYMLDQAGEEYDAIHVMDDVVHGSFYDKLVLFDRFRTGRYLYLDLDLVITGTISHLCRTEFTLLKSWWRPPFYIDEDNSTRQYKTPLNSSIMSWTGDHSYVYKKFMEDPEYYMLKYDSDDEFIWKEIPHETYGIVCDSYNWKWRNTESGNFPITLYNQAKDEIWEHECTLSE